MEAVGHDDVDNVQLALQQGGHVGVDMGDVVRFGTSAGRVGIDVRHGDDVRAVDFGPAFAVNPADASGADESNFELLLPDFDIPFGLRCKSLFYKERVW